MINLPEFTKELITKINNSKRTILFLHKSPDLDSIGSNYGIIQFIENYSKTNEIIIISVDELSINLKSITEKYSKIILNIVDPSNFEFKEGDLAIFIDFAEIHRASRVEGIKLPSFIETAVVDHHVIPEMSGILNFIDTQNISASSIVYKLYEEANLEIKKESFIFLILGILGDSGFLRFKDKNFTHSLEVIKKFCETYGTDDYFEIISEIEKNTPVEEFILEGIYLNNLVYEEKNKFAYTTMTLKERELKQVPLNYSEYLNGATVIRNIGNALFTFSITEDKKEINKFNISFRAASGTGFNVREIAAKLGGGGHIAAAGAQIEAKDILEAIEKVKRVIN
jgi:phosphoesterase RecJ-like protein